MSEDLVVVYYVEADFGWDPAIGKSKCTVKFSFATSNKGFWDWEGERIFWYDIEETVLYHVLDDSGEFRPRGGHG